MVSECPVGYSSVCGLARLLVTIAHYEIFRKLSDLFHGSSLLIYKMEHLSSEASPCTNNLQIHENPLS